MRSTLLVSYGPIPTPEYQQVEGGGMRIYGLASGLKLNGIDVTIAIHEHFPQTIESHEGIKLVNWKHDNDFIKLINSFDTVIVSYSLGDSSTFIQENINDDVQLVVDAYVPSFIEVSARESKDIKNEYVNYFRDLPRYNATLGRGDYFLTANESQELLYTGVLSALGVINPSSYHDKRIIDTPFGIHDIPVEITENPYQKIGFKDTDFKVLWFGGLYPWFRIEEYLESIKELTKDKSVKFVFVGGRNPRNGHPDFEIQYNTAVNFVEKNKLKGSVEFVDWVDFNLRGNWFQQADVIISLNQPAEENRYSWRTRVMDFVWGGAAILTNGGDPLSEYLISQEAAIRLPSMSSQDITSTIMELKKDRKIIATIKKNIQLVKPKYYWKNVTKEISTIIEAHALPYSAESNLRSTVDSPIASQAVTASAGAVTKVTRLIKKTAHSIKDKGIKRTGVAVVKTVNKRLAVGSLKSTREPQFIFLSHPIDNTGAPIVLLNIIEDFVEKYGSNRIRVIAPGLTQNNKEHLKKLGITVEKAIQGIGFRAIRVQLGLRSNDFVFMNTTAIYHNYMQFILLWLKLGRLKHAHWFIHEDIDQCRELLQPQASQIKTLLEKKSLSLYFPSKKTKDAFAKMLGSTGLKSMTMRSEVDSSLKTRHKKADFNTLKFLISGTTTDGRKAQLIAISAFQHFLDTHYTNNPSQYRNFLLTLVSVGVDDYVSQQVRTIGESSLGKHIKIYKNLERNKALKIAHESNVVICCSLHETYALYVAENMLMGSIVLRNDVGGIDEQLKDGVNGHLINTKDIKKFAAVIEKMLNKNTTSNESLLSMSNASIDIAKDFDNANYLEQII
ncbi:MAG: glycosyltransferase [Candidatus Microsaccharimonas sp.]